MKVGDLVRIRSALNWDGQIGIITEFSDRLWWVWLTCGRMIATDRKSDMEVINEGR